MKISELLENLKHEIKQLDWFDISMIVVIICLIVLVVVVAYFVTTGQLQGNANYKPLLRYIGKRWYYI